LANAEKLPDYAPMLSDFHRAYANELRAMIACLPIRDGDRVLEVACGDGVYSKWLAERVGASGSVTAVDVSPAFLKVAQAGAGPRIGFVAAAIERLPFVDDVFDLVWCAQSLYSLPDPVEAVRLMRWVVKPGGVVAVLENDSLHHLLLPWPIEVELAVRTAELKAFVRESDRPRKFYVGRQLDEVFRKAGMVQTRKHTWATNRQSPLDPEVRGFLAKYLLDLLERARPYLDDPMRERFERLALPGSDEYLLDRTDMTVTCLDHLVWGRKPEG
jgi:ubiquinone/menaquinone biosynthesis C-methylase UbiE